MPAFVCRHHRLRWQRSGQQKDAMVPVVLTGTRGRNNESAHGHRAAPATLRLHPTYRSCVKRRIGTPLQTLLASMTEATRQRCSVSLEEPGARVMRGHRATPRGMSSDRPSRRRQTFDSTVLNDGETTLRPSWGRPLLLSSVLRRPRSVNDSLRLSHPQRLDGAHEAIRVDLRASEPELRSHARLLQRGQLTCLPSSPAMGNQGCKLPAQCQNHRLRCCRLIPEMVEKEGGFRH